MDMIAKKEVIGGVGMNKYTMWLDSISNDDKYNLYEMASKRNVKLFQLKESYWQNHFKFYHVNYHVWNTKTLRWRTTTDYRTACTIFNIEVENDADDI